MGIIKIKNWAQWQSYRSDRGTPPWIKVHRNILSNKKWAMLTDSQKGHLVSMWVVAADCNGELPDDPNIIRKICLLDEKPDLQTFEKLGFIELDVTMTSIWRHRDAPETETETETETDKKEDTIVSSKKGSHAKPVGLSDLNITHIEDWLEEKRKSGLYISVDEDRLLERFKNYCTSKNKTYKNYIAAFKNSFEWENVPQKKPNQNKLDPETLKLFKGGGL